MVLPAAIANEAELLRYPRWMTSDAAPVRRRGRPRSTEAEIAARRLKLIRAAYEVFLDKGYNATSIADITAKAGLGFGTYYKAFDNKREILDPVIDYGVEKILGDIMSDEIALDLTPDSIADFEAQLRAIAGRIESAFLARPRLARFLVLEANTIDDELTTRWYGLVDLANSLVSGYLDRGVQRGILRADLDTHETADAVVGIILMSVLRMARSGTAKPAGNYADAAIALIGTGVRPDPTT